MIDRLELLAVVALVAGCKSPEANHIASCDLRAADPAKSGNPATMKECLDWSDAKESTTASDAQKFCDDLGGFIRTGLCPTEGALSRCRPNGPGNAEFVFYPPTAPADASHACAIMQGTLGTP